MPAGHGADRKASPSFGKAPLTCPFARGDDSEFTQLTGQLATSGQISIEQFKQGSTCFWQSLEAAMTMAGMSMSKADVKALAKPMGTDTTVPSMTSTPRMQKQQRNQPFLICQPNHISPNTAIVATA